MLANILKITLRNLYGEKVYSFVNIVGLAVAFCCFLLIFLHIRHQLSFDRHFDQHQNIYRLNTEVTVNGAQRTIARTSPLVAPLLGQDYPQFENYVRFRPSTENNDPTLFLRDGRSFFWHNVYNADNSVFQIFNHTILHGDPATALTEPRSLAISESFAKAYFGDENPVGKTVGVQLPDNEYTVTLVFADLPDNSSLKYDVLIHYNQLASPESEEALFERLVFFDDYTYLRLPEGYDSSAITRISEDFFERYSAEGARRMFPGQAARMDYSLQPLDEIYLKTGIEEDVPSGNVVYLQALGLVGFFIMFIAAMNYINLATARSEKRAKEAGMRRTLGARRHWLVFQFLAEAVTFAFLSLIFALALVELVLSLDFAESFLGRGIELSFLTDASLLLQLAAIAFLLGILAGSYPGLYYSSQPLATAFKSAGLSATGGKGLLRGTLVGVQMLLTVAVIAATFLMVAQMDYLKNRPLGFDKENKIFFRTIMRVDSNDRFRTFVDELRRQPGVLSAAMTDVIPGMPAYAIQAVLENAEIREDSLQVNWNVVDENFLATLDLELMGGRNFSYVHTPSSEVSSRSYIVNETLVRQMGWEAALGKEIKYPPNGTTGRVIGVVEDFNFADLHEAVGPLVLEPYYPNYRWGRYIILSLSSANQSATLARVEEVFRKFMPTSPFEYRWLDQSLDALYATEEKQAQLVGVFSGICVLIAILGLAALAAYTVERRTREIGIRKAYGASSLRIITMLFTPIFGLVLIASVVASGLAWLAVDRWLEGFAYRIGIDPMAFASASSIVLLTAFLTLVAQATRIAHAKPADSLRFE